MRNSSREGRLGTEAPTSQEKRWEVQAGDRPLWPTCRGTRTTVHTPQHSTDKWQGLSRCLGFSKTSLHVETKETQEGRRPVRSERKAGGRVGREVEAGEKTELRNRVF